jgi:hypothetical protein
MTRQLLFLPCFFLLSGCYPHLMPSGPVVDAEDTFLGPMKSSGVDYSGQERLRSAPVLPFIPWGLDFPEEMLFEFASHPTYGMVEITEVEARDGRREWFALVSERSGVQHVVVGSREAAKLARAFPAPVWEGALEVVSVRSDTQLQYRARFTLPNGEGVDALITAKGKGSALPKRNGNAMNHSQDAVLAVLDLEEFNWASAVVKVDGKSAPIRQLAPFVPFAWRLEQAAGGLGSGALWMAAGTQELQAEREPSGEQLEFVSEQAGNQVIVTQSDALLETRWTFENGGVSEGPLELRELEIIHGEVSVFRMRMNPALPDLRYGPQLGFEAKVVAGSNGREGYMTGTLRTHLDKEARLVIDVLPESPAWACERPVRNRLSYIQSRADLGGGTGVRLESRVEPTLAAGGAGRAACW